MSVHGLQHVIVEVVRIDLGQSNAQSKHTLLVQPEFLDLVI